MKQVLDWKFFLRIAVAIAALSIFLSAALADGDKSMNLTTHYKEVLDESNHKLKQLLFVYRFLKDKDETEVSDYLEKNKPIACTYELNGGHNRVNVTLTELVFFAKDEEIAGALTRLINKNQLLQIIDKAIRQEQDEIKDITSRLGSVERSVAAEGHHADPAPQATPAVESSKYDELTALFVKCIQKIQADNDQKMLLLVAGIEKVASGLNEKIEKQKSEFAQALERMGLVLQSNRTDQVISGYEKDIEQLKQKRDELEVLFAQTRNPREKEQLAQYIASLDMQIQMRSRHLGSIIQNQQYALYNDHAQKVLTIQADAAKLQEEYNKEGTSAERKTEIASKLLPQKQAELMQAQIEFPQTMQRYQVTLQNLQRDLYAAADPRRAARIRNPRLASLDEEQQYNLMLSAIGGRFQGQGVSYPVGQRQPVRTFGDAVSYVGRGRIADALAQGQSIPYGNDMVDMRTPSVPYDDGFSSPLASGFPLISPSMMRNPVQDWMDNTMQQQVLMQGQMEQMFGNGLFDII